MPRSPLHLNQTNVRPLFVLFSSISTSYQPASREAPGSRTTSYDLSLFFSYASALFCATEPSQFLSHQSLPHSFPCNGRCVSGSNPFSSVFRRFFQVTYNLSSFLSHSSENCRGGWGILPKTEPRPPLPAVAFFPSPPNNQVVAQTVLPGLQVRASFDFRISSLVFLRFQNA